jgi:hypothetical protein
MRVSSFIGIDGLLLMVLLSCLCHRVWGMGPMHTDDAMWALMAYQPFEDPVGAWANSQGRLWAFVIGPMMRYALKQQGTAIGELLKLGSFAMFFFAFFGVVAAYWGRRLAGLAGCLFIALFALRWEGSAFTAYPLLVWASAIACAVAILAGRYYYISGRRPALFTAGLLLLLALFNNEGIALLFCVLFLCSVLANAAGGEPLRDFKLGKLAAGRSRHLLLLSIGIPLVYAAMAGLWLATHPTKYDGHSFAPFDLANIATALMNFSLSGSILYDLFVPYRVVYSDNLTLTGSAVLYDFYSYPEHLLSHPIAPLVGLLTAWALFVTVRRTHAVGGSGWGGVGLILVGVAIAIIPILPVAMTSKYQGWNLNYNINSYTMTVLAHFGSSLVLAGLLTPLLYFRNSFGAVIALVIAAAIGGLGAVGYRMNDAIAADMRPEAVRWRVVTLALQTLDATGQTPSILFAPKLKSGTWFTVVPPDYWSNYVNAKFGRQISVFTEPSEIHNNAADMSVLDYGIQDDERKVLFTIAHVTGSLPGRRIDNIAVGVERADPSLLAFYVLSFRDQNGELVQKRLIDLPRTPGLFQIRTITGLAAQLDSVRLTKGSIMADSGKPEKPD